MFHAKLLLSARFAIVSFDYVVSLSDKRTKYSTSNVPGHALSVISYVVSSVGSL